MPPIASDAVVLRTYKLGETSKIVVLLTRERGKVRAVAKGARGVRTRYQSALEPLSEVRVGLYGRQGTDLYRLGECELIRSAFPAHSADLEAALSLSYFAELLEAFAQEGEAEDAVYRLALAVLGAAQGGAPVSVLAPYLEAWLLRLHGIYPPLDRCARCGQGLPGGELRYHSAARGFVCLACGPPSGPLLPVPVRSFLEQVFHRAPHTLAGPPPPGAPLLDSFHQDLISQHLERAIRSKRVLRDVARGQG